MTTRERPTAPFRQAGIAVPGVDIEELVSELPADICDAYGLDLH